MHNRSNDYLDQLDQLETGVSEALEPVEILLKDTRGLPAAAASIDAAAFGRAVFAARFLRRDGEELIKYADEIEGLAENLYLNRMLAAGAGS